MFYAYSVVLDRPSRPQRDLSEVFSQLDELRGSILEWDSARLSHYPKYAYPCHFVVSRFLAERVGQATQPRRPKYIVALCFCAPNQVAEAREHNYACNYKHNYSYKGRNAVQNITWNR